MPLYDYTCSNCGPFRLMRPMAQSDAPTACPACGRLSTKTVTAPFLADMAPQNRIACQRNEKSAHVPRVMSRGEFDLHDSHSHGHGDADHAHAGKTSLGEGPWVRSRHRSMLGH
ncbi:FmdB family zinc ribbon protein [Paraburkholderia sp. 2C]